MRMKGLVLSTILLSGFLLLSPSAFALQEKAEIEQDVVVASDQRWHGKIQLIPGGVTHGSEAKIVEQMDKLIGAALDKDPTTATYEKAVTHYRKKSQKVKATTSDAVNAIVPFTGFSHSSEAGDVILDEKLKLCSKASAEYAKQKNVDEKHKKVSSALMHVATGLGGTDPTQVADVTASGLQRLQALVGDTAATEMFETLKTWKQDLTLSEAVYAQKMWTPDQQEEKLQAVISKALETDLVIGAIEKQIYKYNHMSKGKRAAGKVFRTTLGAACLVPTFVGPAAQVGLTAFEVATGGPEESKLLKELYLLKRIESRSKVLSEQAHLALNSYQMGLLTKNPMQLALSELLITDLVGPELASQVIAVPILDSTKNLAAMSPDAAAKAKVSATTETSLEAGPKASATEAPLPLDAATSKTSTTEATSDTGTNKASTTEASSNAENNKASVPAVNVNAAISAKPRSSLAEKAGSEQKSVSQ